MNYHIIASIIQGEAGVLGPVGMYAVATVISTQVHAGWTAREIESAWCARSKPEDFATALADMLALDMIPASGYLHCMSAQDVKKNKWARGDVVIEATGTVWALHLYRRWPEKDAFQVIEDEVVEMINEVK